MIIYIKNYFKSYNGFWFTRFVRYLGYLKLLPKVEYKYVYRNGTRIGPFVYSTEWTNLDNIYKRVFNNNFDILKKEVEKSAHNKNYKVPDDSIFAIRDIFWYYYYSREDYKQQLISAKKEISKLKRQKG